MNAPKGHTPPSASHAKNWTAFAKDDPVAAGFAILAFIFPWLALLSPRATGALVPVMAVLILGAHLWTTRRLTALKSKGWGIVLAFLALVAISALWAPDTNFAVKRASKLALLVPLGFALVLLAKPAAPPTRKRIQMALLAGTALAVFLMIYHLITGGGLYGLFNPDESRMSILNSSNKAATQIVLLSAAVFLSARALGRTATAWAALAGLFVLFALSPNQSTPLALIVWAIAYVLAARAPRFALGLTRWGGTALILLMPFVFAGLLYLDQSRMLDWGAASVGARLDIYYAVSYKALMSPLYGYGVEAARFMTDWPTAFAYLPSTEMHHPHNGILQVWLEFGVIGAALAAAAWAMFVRQLGAFATTQQPALIASLAAFFFILCLTYGLWQSWWVCAMAGAVALTRLMIAPQETA